MIDDLKKSYKSYNKTKDNYNRLIMDTENIIRARDSAIRDETKSSEVQAQEEGFINRSFSKILKPNIAKLNDKCYDSIREIDSVETQLNFGCKKFNSSRETLIEEFYRVLVELFDLDKTRIANVKESLTRLSVSEDLLYDRLHIGINAVNEQISSFLGTSRINSLLSLPPTNQEAYKWNETINLLPSDFSLQSCGLSYPIFSIEHFTMVDRIIFMLDTFKTLSNRAVQTLMDSSEAEKIFKRSSQRLFERQGYLKYQNNEQSSQSLLVVSPFERANKSYAIPGSCIELINTYESPMTRTAVESSIKALWDTSLNHQDILSSTYNNSSVVQLDQLIKSIDQAKQDLNEKLLYEIKRIDSFKFNLSKFCTKLTKIQKELKDRRKSISEKNAGSVPNPESENISNYLSDEDVAPSPSNSQHNEELLSAMYIT
jgi:hypothetical protein